MFPILQLIQLCAGLFFVWMCLFFSLQYLLWMLLHLASKPNFSFQDILMLKKLPDMNKCIYLEDKTEQWWHSSLPLLESGRNISHHSTEMLLMFREMRPFWVPHCAQRMVFSRGSNTSSLPSHYFLKWLYPVTLKALCFGSLIKNKTKLVQSEIMNV